MLTRSIHTGAWAGGTLAALVSWPLAVACCKPAAAPAPVRPNCVIGIPAAPGFPRLYRALSTAPAHAHYAAAPICAKPHALADECEVVDDAQALLGTGFDCVNGADAPVGACEGWSHPSSLQAAPDPPPCGPDACEDLSFSARDPSGALVHITFYDDVSCHTAPREANCQRTGRRCYYRILRVDPSPG